jgi:hypothetical protein
MSDYGAALNRLVAWAAFFHDAQTLEDLADLSLRDLMKESGLLAVSHAIPVAQAADDAISALEVGSAFEQFYQSLDDRRQVIALRRTYADEPEVLEQLGAEFGVSRERARQLEADVTKAFQERAAVRFMRSAMQLRQTLPMIVSGSALEAILDRLVDEASPGIRRAAKVALLRNIGYERVEESWASREFRQLANQLRERGPDFANPLGIIDEDSLRESFERLNDDTWLSLTAAAGLKRVQGSLVLRDTREVRLLLVLGRLGEPATRDRLAELTDLEVRSLGTVLSGSDSFVRVTKDTWGLTGWTDDPYDGVVGEIIQRIESGCGEARVSDLLTEIPDRFQVSASTVQAYLATPKFVIYGDFVRLAETTVVDAPPLTQLRDVVWTESGQPVLRLTVLEHHLGGWSIKIPPAVAIHLGVGPDTDRMVPVRHPEGCQAVSVIWRAHDPNGPEFGRLREALLALGAKPGAEVFVTLEPSGLTITDDGRSFQVRSRSSPPETGRLVSEAPPGSPSPALERMKLRRRL